MKKLLALGAALGLLASSALGQVTFTTSAGNTVAIDGTITSTTVGNVFTVDLLLENYSDPVFGYANGILTGIGINFDTTLFTYKVGSFAHTQGTPIAGSGKIGTDFVDFEFGQLPGSIILDIGAKIDQTPADGLAGGFAATFTFAFDIVDTTLTLDDFFGAKSPDLSFRFQSVGPTGNTNDSAKFTVEFDGGDGFEVPEPSTYGLMGALALLGLAAFRRFRRK